MAFAAYFVDRFYDALVGCVDFCVLQARSVVLAAGLVTVASLAVTVFFLTVNTDPTGMINSELDFRQRYDAYARAFPQLDQTLVAVVDGETSEIATEATRSLVASFESRSDLFADVYAPGVDPYFDSHGLLYLSEEELAGVAAQMQAGLPLIGALARDQTLRGLAQLFQGLGQQMQQGATLASFAPFLEELDRIVQSHAEGRDEDLEWDRFLSAGGVDRRGTRRFVLIKPILDFNSLAPAEEAMSEAHRLASDPETHFSGAAQIRFTGDIALNAEELRSVTDSVALAGIISLVLVSIVLAAGVRSWRLVAASLISLVVGLVWTAGFATLVIGYLNLISVAFAVLFVGLGIDFAIHFSLRYEEESRRGRPLRIALANTAEGVGGALAMCTCAAAMGFLAFTPTSFHGMAQLGVISAAGMVIAFTTTMTVLPALLALMPLSPNYDEPESNPARQRRHLFPSWRYWATGLTAAACVGAVFFLPHVRFDGDPVNLKDPNTPSVQTYMELFRDGASSPYTIQVLTSDETAISQLSVDITSLPEVRGVVSIFSFLPQGQERKLPVIQTLQLGVSRLDLREPSDIGEAARSGALQTIQEFMVALSQVPDAQTSAAALGLLRSFRAYAEAAAGDPSRDARLERAIFRKLPAIVDRIRTAVSASAVSVATLPEAMRSRYLSADGQYRLEVLPVSNLSAEDELRGFVDAVLTVAPQATGAPVEIIGASDVVVEAMFIATAIAGVLILLVLLATMQSIIDTLLVFLPIALAATLTFAATVLFDIPFNFANVIVLPLLIGLGVAGGVHLVARARAEGGSAAFMRTNTPRAVLLSALTTIGSFASLGISDHRGMASMGFLLTIAIAFTLICTLIVLPTVLEGLAKLRRQ
jgi:hypothetical protein